MHLKRDRRIAPGRSAKFVFRGPRPDQPIRITIGQCEMLYNATVSYRPLDGQPDAFLLKAQIASDGVIHLLRPTAGGPLPVEEPEHPLRDVFPIHPTEKACD